jgi:hypothetical protein
MGKFTKRHPGVSKTVFHCWMEGKLHEKVHSKSEKTSLSKRINKKEYSEVLKNK